MKAIPTRSKERGEGQIGSIVMLVVMIVIALVAKEVGPLYWDNYQLEDRLTTIAGTFPPNKDGDTRAIAAVQKAVAEAGITQYLTSDCTVTSSGGIGGLRTVTCNYTRDYRLFGSRKSKSFEISVSRPMF